MIRSDCNTARNELCRGLGGTFGRIEITFLNPTVWYEKKKIKNITFQSTRKKNRKKITYTCV